MNELIEVKKEEYDEASINFGKYDKNDEKSHIAQYEYELHELLHRHVRIRITHDEELHANYRIRIIFIACLMTMTKRHLTM